MKSWFDIDSFWLEHDNHYDYWLLYFLITFWFKIYHSITIIYQIWVLLNHAERHSSEFCYNRIIHQSFLFQTPLAETQAILASRHISRLLHFLIWVWQLVKYCLSGSCGVWWSSCLRARPNYVFLFVLYSSFSGSWLIVAYQPTHMLFISI